MDKPRRLFPDAEHCFLSGMDTSNVECPHCGRPLEACSDDHEGWPQNESEYRTEAECPYCEREFLLVCEAVVQYSAEVVER